MRRDVAQWLLRYGAANPIIGRLTAASERRASVLQPFWQWSVWLGTAVAIETKLRTQLLALPRELR